MGKFAHLSPFSKERTQYWKEIEPQVKNLLGELNEEVLLKKGNVFEPDDFEIPTIGLEVREFSFIYVSLSTIGLKLKVVAKYKAKEHCWDNVMLDSLHLYLEWAIEEILG